MKRMLTLKDKQYNNEKLSHAVYIKRYYTTQNPGQ